MPAGPLEDALAEFIAQARVSRSPILSVFLSPYLSSLTEEVTSPKPECSKACRPAARGTPADPRSRPQQLLIAVALPTIPV